MENKENVKTTVQDEEIKTEEVLEETDEEDEEESLSPENYKAIIDMIKEMESEYKMLKEITSIHVNSQYGLSSDVLTRILPLTEEYIKNEMTMEEMEDFLEKNKENVLIDIRVIGAIIIKTSTEDEEMETINTLEDAYRYLLLDIKRDSMTLFNTEKSIKDLRDQSSDVLKEYFTYYSSKELRKMKLERLDIMKKEVEKESDEKLKKQMEKKIADMEAAYSLSFLFTRIEKFGKKEIENIKDAFFDKAKGSYIIDKYRSKIESFGFKDKLYRYFFNIEETFLPEEYHVYNNLYLFIYMRMVAYADANNKTEKLFVQSLTSTMANLVYHRFEEKINEDEFITIVERLLDNFAEYKDFFEKYNAMHPNHPKRIEATKKREKERREFLMTKMDQMGITGYPEDACADDLQNYLNDSIEKMLQEQSKPGEETNVDEDEDGVVSITPKMETKEEDAVEE